MNYNKSVGMINYANLIDISNSLLSCTAYQINEKYYDDELHEISWLNMNNKEDILEIRFDEVNATFACEFDKNKICYAINIFTDMDIDRIECAEFLNSQYKFNWFKRRWSTPFGFVYLRKQVDVVYLRCILK